MNKTVDMILKRRSVRRFKPDMIKEEELKTIIECGLYAPSAKDKQNWHFTVITNKDRIDEISRMALAGMNHLGLEKPEDFHIFYHAPVVIVVSSKLDGNSGVNAGCAVENMAIAATSLGVGSCIIGQTRYCYHLASTLEGNRVLGIPERYEHEVSICFGYPEGPLPDAKPRKENLVKYIR